MNNKPIILTGSVAIVGFVLAIVWWILSPAWVPLFSHEISDSSQQNVLFLLNENNIEYKLDSAEKAILVKSADLRKSQVMLAENGQPEAETSGLEVFNSSDYGLSEFAQSVNYQRGMEEELARTIKKLKGVKDARVHLTIKKDSLFEERKQPPKASIVVSLHQNQALDGAAIRGIQEIIAAAVPNLEPKQVVVITDAGHVLSPTDRDFISQGAIDVEQKYSKQISGLLAAIMDENDYKISVNVITDNRKKVTVAENFYPDVNTGKGFVTQRKFFEKSLANENFASDSPQMQKSNEEEFVYSKERSEIVFPAGEIIKVTVGIVIRKSLTQVDKDNISKLVFNTLGMIETRGDKVSLFASAEANVSKPLSTEIDKPVVSEAKNAVHEVPTYVNWLLIIIAVLSVASVILLVMYLQSVKRSRIALSDRDFDNLSNELKNWISTS